MPIRERVQRLWRFVVDWWRPPTDGRSTTAGTPSAPAQTSRPATTRQRAPARERAAAPDGESLITGAVTVRMWIVSGRLILATSAAEAERALVTLLPELDADGQAAARRVLDGLRGGHAQAA